MYNNLTLIWVRTAVSELGASIQELSCGTDKNAVVSLIFGIVQSEKISGVATGKRFGTIDAV